MGNAWKEVFFKFGADSLKPIKLSEKLFKLAGDHQIGKAWGGSICFQIFARKCCAKYIVALYKI